VPQTKLPISTGRRISFSLYYCISSINHEATEKSSNNFRRLPDIPMKWG